MALHLRSRGIDPGAMGTLTFLGAAGTVIGNKFLIDSAEGSILVDAGLR